MNRKAALLVLLIVVSGGIFLFLDFVSIGPGLPPPEEMFPNTWRPVEKGSPPFFPEVSSQCYSGNYSRHKFITAWYFDDRAAFLKGERILYRFLKEEGRVFVEEFDLNEELRIYGRETSGPVFFNATGYEGENVSGYFLVYERPFFEERDDYFIVFYGVMEDDLSEQKPALKKLMAKSFWHRGEGVRELAPSRLSVRLPEREGLFFPAGLPDICCKAFANIIFSNIRSGPLDTLFSSLLECVL